MMRIVVTTSIFPPDIGGPATHADDLASELRGLRWCGLPRRRQSLHWLPLGLL